MKFEDNPINTANWKYGIYHVSDKNFSSKYNALVDASKTKQSVKWNFHYDKFSNEINKILKLGCSLTLPEIYLQRAIQLRDTYDYLILAYGGGADADNILQIFVKNKIHLNEVWSDWPLTMIEKSGYKLNTSTSSTNMASEWFLAAKPTLDNLKLSNPEIKIHLSDQFLNGPQKEDFEDTCSHNNWHTHYVALKRWRYINEYIDKNFKGKKVAVITGNDKPIPVIHPDRKSYGFVFSDLGTSFRSHTSDISKTIEYFYWTADMPALPILQAIKVWDYLKLNPAIIKEKFKFQKQEYAQNKEAASRTLSMDNVIKFVCYPYWNFHTHQVDKPYYGADKNIELYNMPLNSSLYSKLLHNWIYSPWLQSYIYSVNESLKLLNPEIAFQNKQNFNEDLRVFYNYHKLGEINSLNI